jgi:2-methylaconitate cis-trans-isomerase PrpF
MCGNLASAVGYFAIQEGLVSSQVPSTRIQIYCKNNGKLITAEVPTDEHGSVSIGTTRIDGVPGRGARVGLSFHDPAGSMTEGLMPLGTPSAVIDLPDGSTIEVSVVDSGALYAFVDAAELGVSGEEAPSELDRNQPFRDRVELVRAGVADAVSRQGASALKASQVKVAVLGRRRVSESTSIPFETFEITARVVNPERTHKAFPVGGAVAMASAAVLPGSFGNPSPMVSHSPAVVLIHHPAGTFPAKVSFASDGRSQRIEAVEIERTARILMTGTAFLGAFE